MFAPPDPNLLHDLLMLLDGGGPQTCDELAAAKLEDRHTVWSALRRLEDVAAVARVRPPVGPDLWWTPQEVPS